MSLTRQRAFVTPRPGEDWDALAGRIFPGEDRKQVVEKLRSWNLHLFARIPPGQFTGADVLFIEPPHDATPSEAGRASQTGRDGKRGG